MDSSSGSSSNTPTPAGSGHDRPPQQQEYPQQAYVQPNAYPPTGQMGFQPQGVMVPFPIPGEHMTKMVRGALRMQLLTRYPGYNRYTPTPDEAMILKYHYMKGWASFFMELGLPVWVWFKTAKPLTMVEIETLSRGDATVAKRLEVSYSKGLGWPLPGRLAAVLVAFMLSRTVSGMVDESYFEKFLPLQSPMGDYARYLLNEGQRAAQFGLSTIPHPPFPPPYPGYPPHRATDA